MFEYVWWFFSPVSSIFTVGWEVPQKNNPIESHEVPLFFMIYPMEYSSNPPVPGTRYLFGNSSGSSWLIPGIWRKIHRENHGKPKTFHYCKLGKICLVVEKPSWTTWVRQWGWDDIPYIKWKIKFMLQTTNQKISSFAGDFPWTSRISFYPSKKRAKKNPTFLEVRQLVTI